MPRSFFSFLPSSLGVQHIIQFTRNCVAVSIVHGKPVLQTGGKRAFVYIQRVMVADLRLHSPPDSGIYREACFTVKKR